MMTYVHILVVVPDGRVLLQRIVYKWEATISRVTLHSETADEAAKAVATMMLGVNFEDGNKLDFLIERYEKKSDTTTVVYTIMLKSGSTIILNGVREAMAVSLEEVVDYVAKHKYKVSQSTVHLVDILKDLRVVGIK